MEKFIKISGKAAPLLIKNIDTDQIIPKQFLTTVKRDGLANGLFYDWRFDINGKKNKDFILNKQEFYNSNILLTDDNFGCGSSREHAPWALLDFGISCIIAPTFADIFNNNCIKNGLLTIELPIDKIKEIAEISDSTEITIDLEKQTIIAGNLSYNFNIDNYKKDTLLNGLDDITLTKKISDKIKDYEQKNKTAKPWV